jgi:hypothetical protein
MSQYTVITDGFGTFGNASFVITEGYSSSDEVITPSMCGMLTIALETRDVNIGAETRDVNIGAETRTIIMGC